MVALKAQIEQNKIYGVHGLTAQETAIKKQATAQQNIVNTATTQITNLQKQLKASGLTSAQRASLNAQITAEQKTKAAAQAKYTSLNSQYSNINTNTIPLEQQLYNQPQIGNDSVTWLQNDLLIQQWLQTQSSAIQTKINPTQSEINTFLNGVKANLPAGTTYSNFLSKDGVSDSDMQQMAAVIVRRQNTQTYMASLEKSPQYQVLARMITLSTQKDANSILTQLQHGGNFAKLAVAKSVDTNTNKQGGFLNWEACGQYAQAYSAATVENWMFDPARKLDQISPVIVENGSYRIVQILGIDPSRAVDKPTLQTLQTNALSDWLLQVQALPSTKITPLIQACCLMRRTCHPIYQHLLLAVLYRALLVANPALPASQALLKYLNNKNNRASHDNCRDTTLKHIICVALYPFCSYCPEPITRNSYYKWQFAYPIDFKTYQTNQIQSVDGEPYSAAS